MFNLDGINYYTTSEIAKKLDTKGYTVRRWLRLGYLKFTCIGKRRFVSETEIVKVLNKKAGE